MKYIYQARSKEGKIETGTVEASNKEAAAALLQKYGVIVTSIKEQSSFVLSTENISFLNKVSKKDLAIFSRQLAVMLQSRVPVVQSLKSLSVQTKNPKFKADILKIAQLVEEGNSLSESFSTFPETFSLFYISLMKTGEASGKISDSLYYMSNHLEREYDIESQLRSAMIYPAFVVLVLIAVMMIMMFFVMPKMVQLIRETVQNPPVFTLFVIRFYDFLAHYGWVILLAFFALVAFLMFYFTTKEGRKIMQRLMLKMPVISDFLKKIYLIRFAENISTLITAGLPINSALKITKGAVDNIVYKEILQETEEKVSGGEKISSVLIRYPKLVPAFVVQMIQVGEETGKLDKNLMEIVKFYEKEVDRAVATFTAMLEPILIIFLGLVVAFLAITIIEPLYGTIGSI